MLKRILTVAGAVALVAGMTVTFAGFAAAEQGIAPGGCVPNDGPRDGRGGGLLERLDTDGDGQVSRAEYESHFDRLDADGDGFVTREEVGQIREERRTERRERMFERDDTDGDRMISRDEFSGPQDLFAKVDADHDGYITEQEAMEFRPKRDGMRRGGQRGPGMDGDRRGPGRPGGPAGMN